MPDLCGNAISCKQVLTALAQECVLTQDEFAHVEVCDACREAWLDTTVLRTLEAKPEVRIPADFVSGVVAQLPEYPGTEGKRRTRFYDRHWGLLTATLLAAMGLFVLALADPGGMDTRTGSLFVALVASEIAGIGLWLGISGSSERRF